MIISGINPKDGRQINWLVPDAIAEILSKAAQTACEYMHNNRAHTSPDLEFTIVIGTKNWECTASRAIF